MPVIPSSAYQTCEAVLSRIRMFLNDSEVPGGDVLTDAAPFTFDVLNAAFERVQIELASVGVETYTNETWLMALPAVTTSDPEARVIVSDTGSILTYPSGAGDAAFDTPLLPSDLILPMKLWERQNGTTNYVGPPMRQPNDGLRNLTQQTYLIDWQWMNDTLIFRGALQVQDVKLKYEKQLTKLAATTDPVPIRGVTNAAAYRGAEVFCESRGGMVSPVFKQNGDDEINFLKMISSRRRQRIQTRRQPYSGRRHGHSSTY